MLVIHKDNHVFVRRPHVTNDGGRRSTRATTTTSRVTYREREVERLLLELGAGGGAQRAHDAHLLLVQVGGAEQLKDVTSSQQRVRTRVR